MRPHSIGRYSLIDNIGNQISVPFKPEDDFAYFCIGDFGESIASYYENNGYVVIRGLISDDLLDAANDAFDEQIIPSNRFIYRQATANPERHSFTAQGFMVNSILNCKAWIAAITVHFGKQQEKVLTAATTQRVLPLILGEPGKLVQSMYFHGNPMTWPHQDTYYLDSEHIGAMTAIWIAAEDIVPGCGRFFVYPGSHKIDMKKNGGDFDIAFHHGRYKQLVCDIISKENLECRAPALRKGDVLFWNAKTIHGSLPISYPNIPVALFHAHSYPAYRFLANSIKSLWFKFQETYGMQAARPNIRQTRNGLSFFVEAHISRHVSDT